MYMNTNISHLDTDRNYQKQFWHKTINNLTFGFMMTLVTLNFAGLQFLLPLVGSVLLYIGFRDLKHINKNLYTAWIFSIINMIIYILNLIYVSTPLYIKFELGIIRPLILTAFQLSFLILFRQGINDIFQKNNTKLKNDPILLIIFCYILIMTYALFCDIQFVHVTILFVGFYFYTFNVLCKLKYDLENFDFEEANHSSGLFIKNIFIRYSILCSLLVATCCVISNHIKVDSSIFISGEAIEDRQILIMKGFPESILNNLSDDDISLFKSPISIECFSEDLNYFSTNNKNLKSTTIFVEVPNNELYAIESFNWQEGNAYWNDGFSISASEDVQLKTGRMVYEKNGIKYTSKIPNLTDGKSPNNYLSGYTGDSNKITGNLSFPFGSTNQSCYIIYSININDNTIFGGNIVNYYHNLFPFKVPYSLLENDTIMFNDKMKQHYSNFRIIK